MVFQTPPPVAAEVIDVGLRRHAGNRNDTAAAERSDQAEFDVFQGIGRPRRRLLLSGGEYSQ